MGTHQVYRRRYILQTMKLHWPFIAVLAIVFAGCGPRDSKTPTSSTGTAGTTVGSTTGGAKPATGLAKLEIRDLKIGDGQTVETGDFVIVKYHGKFKDGSQFDQNSIGGLPFVVGQGDVIEGWDKGVVGMKEGGVRSLGVPWKMAYGEMGRGQIPPKTDLYFDVALMGLVKKGQENVIVPTEIRPGNGKPVGEGDLVTIHSELRMVDGSLAWNSKKRKKPATFRIGEGKAYAHIEEGVKGMKPGGVREIRVPPMAGFGAQPLGPTIPANMILVYKIELMDVKYK
jgi:FKBP-type peptidyl-prolyl cis-trans isomerase